MNNVPFDSKDLSLILAIKPFLTPQGQKTIDGFISILEVLGRPAKQQKGKTRHPGGSQSHPVVGEE